MLATLVMFGIVGAIFMLQEERLERFRMRYEQEHSGTARSQMYETGANRQQSYRSNAGGNDKDQDFYKDFKGVPIYDPRKDYEDMNHFDV